MKDFDHLISLVVVGGVTRFHSPRTARLKSGRAMTRAGVVCISGGGFCMSVRRYRELSRTTGLPRRHVVHPQRMARKNLSPPRQLEEVTELLMSSATGVHLQGRTRQVAEVTEVGGWPETS